LIEGEAAPHRSVEGGVDVEGKDFKFTDPIPSHDGPDRGDGLDTISLSSESGSVMGCVVLEALLSALPLDMLKPH